AGPPSTVRWEATPSSAARASMNPRSSASTPPVSAKTVWTFQPRSARYGTPKLVSRPPEKARTMSLLMMGGSQVRLMEGGSGSGAGQRSHDRLLYMQAVLGFFDGDAARRIHHRIGGLDVAAQWQAVAEDGIVGQGHLLLVDD